MPPAQRDLTDVVQAAREAGALASEVLVRDEHTVSHTLTDGRLVRREASRTEAMVVRCWREGGRCGLASGTPADGERLVKQALAAAAKAPEDPYAGPVRRMESVPRGLGLSDPRHEQLADTDRLEVIHHAAQAARKAKADVSLGTFWWKDVVGTRRFLNSHGVAHEVALTSYETGGALLLHNDGPDIRLDDHIEGRAFASVACLPYGTMLAQRAEALSGDGPPVSGPMRVLLPPRPTGHLFAWLATLFTVDALEEGRSFVARAQAEPLFHRKLHLVDDGMAHGGVRTLGFDDRGVTPVPLTLLREGRVAARFLDPERARALDTRPTGHVIGTGLAPTNLQLNSGARSINAWMGEQDVPVFEIDDLSDLSGIDPLTGDIDLVVHGVQRLKHVVVGPRRHVRLTGNLVEALGRVHGVVSDTDRIGHVDAPGLFLDGLSLEG